MPYFGYFNDLNIILPTEVKNAIEDVFMENDNIDSVECYHVEDKDVFEKDTTLRNSVNLYLGNKNNGTTYNVFTYYGFISYILNEEITLFDNEGKVLEEISKLESEDYSSIEKPDDWVVTVIEEVSWTDSGELTRTPKLYIYCPKSDGNENEYANVYNELKNEGF